MSAEEQAQQLDRAIDRLAGEFRGVFSPESVAHVAKDSYARLAATATVDAFLPLLAERFARDRLRALAQAEGRAGKERPEVLFVCVQNAGRSQMAALLTHHRSGGRVSVRSAGSAPAGAIHDVVAEAMREVGLDLGEAFPKPLTDEVVRAADVVITMGCGDACPLHPGVRYLDWEVGDPAGQPLERVREIREEITGRVDALLAELGVVAPPASSGAAAT